MNLKKFLQKTVSNTIEKTFHKMGLSESMTYRCDTGPIQHSTQDGQLTRTTTDIETKAVFASFELQEQQKSDGAIQPNDLKCLVSSQALGAHNPSPHEQIIREDGSVWTVVGVKTDPVNAMWTLQIRKP